MTTTLVTRPLTGTVFAAADTVLAASPQYAAFRAGALTRADYGALVDARADDLRAAGVPAGDVPFMKRFPRDPARVVERVVADLHGRGMLTTALPDAALLARAARMMEGFEHGPFKTYIYPEEGRVLAALAHLRAPRHALFLGSYYGYWAHWAASAVAAGGGRMTLVDPDPACCEVARRNLAANGLDGAVEIAVTRGEPYLAASRETYDFVALDAENPRDHPDAEQRGKRVYHSLMRACLPHLAPGALLVCHNILFTDTTLDPAFAGVIARNRDELGPFAGLLADAFGPFVEYRTTEGVGVGQYTGARCADRWPVAPGLDADERP
jgi:predicted O-methyltransferase YrrM